MRNTGEELSERKKLILKAIIEAHVRCGEPVGSKYLTSCDNITFSSATIRNEMAELEEMGYLEQPHTSAGRIPSERGYRFYVNSLMQNYRLTSAELKALGGVASAKAAQIDRLLEDAARVMSGFTRYTSLAVKPKPGAVVIRRFKAIPLNEHAFLLVMITNTDVIKTRHVVVRSLTITEEMLSSLEAVLNVYLTDITMDRVTLPVMMEMEEHLPPTVVPLVSPVVKSVYEVVGEMNSGELMLEGMNRLLEYPEYADIDRLRSIMTLLEKKDDILNIVSSSEQDITNVYIGSENVMDVMRQSSLIFKTVSKGGRVIGAIGVIGPCRMDYSRVITAVEYMASTLGQAVQESDGQLTDGLKKDLDP